MTEIRINLLPPEIFEKRRAERILIYLISGLIVFILILLGISFGISFRVSKVEKKVEKLKSESDELSKKIVAYKRYEQERSKLQKQEEILGKALAGERSWHQVLNEVAMVIPSDVWLVELTGDTTSVKFKGYTFEHPSVAEWLDRLSKVSQFSDVWLDYSQEKELEEQPVVEFESSARFKGAPPEKTKTGK